MSKEPRDSEQRELDGDHPQNARFKRVLVISQLVGLILVALGFLLWTVVEAFWPSFFSPFEWSRGTADVAESVLAFWPLFLYAAATALVSLFNLIPSFRTGTSDEGHLAYDTATSVLAGTSEELGYRCVFILTSMIAVMVSNFLWSWLWVLLAVASVVYFFLVMGKSESNRAFLVGAVLTVASVALLFFTWDLKDPVYWIYQNIFFKMLSAVSFGAIDSILDYEAAPALFIMGAVSANAKFRDGHKYQGPLGYLNAWVVGFILLYAMLYHGLWVAILVHAILDLEIGAIRYLGRKVDRLQEG